MATDSNGFDTRIGGGQKQFLLSLMVFSLIGAVGFSLFIFGAVSQFMATTTDRLITGGLGLAMMMVCGFGVYTVLR